ncbi:uncharacterized protein BO80DRAFT_498083 [Aspergillus ibericus CBS 121593]|uniref:Aminoglycoside phosphotransferase domain-containing protein n=1 Tax=Aspergillus ibericus CBS 121593 TaxID=1448316 RepID=A0A395GIZ3_9EURO|nr:hypothetical protein BO80DRAFT_498083 [Aspergillus ibericus CBS 121593]RAK95008.1 hypothetical protein BO80DRAFT_498083 [Aspergillus ibericus CBS 121593]
MTCFNIRLGDGCTSFSLYNEHVRLSERYLKFDVSALKNVAALASGYAPSDIAAFSRLSEGGFNRIFQVTLKDGRCVIARLPYPSTVPKRYAVASEVATLDYLRLHGIRTPKVCAWSSTNLNPVGSEYIIIEKLGGTPLGDIWYSMTQDDRRKMMKQIVEWETRLMSLKFPAYGSFQKDAGFCIGPIAHYNRWLGERSTMLIDRGPWLSSTDIFRAVGERELVWTKSHAKSRVPYERLYRETYHFRKVSPDPHIQNLSDYLKIAPFLGFGAETALHRPVIRHPDFQPNNILVSDSHEILPPNFDSLPETEQAYMREILRRRMVHFLYAIFTKELNEEHYDAIFDDINIVRQRILESAGTPWEGDSVTLRVDIMRAIQSWPGFFAEFIHCVPPVRYPDKDADDALEQMRHALNADVLGWVPNSEYDDARKLAQEMKDKILEVVETDHDITAARDHFPFDDFDEDV